MELNEKQKQLCTDSQWDFSDLQRAVHQLHVEESLPSCPTPKD